jgi:hypothetical protein
MGTKNHSGLGSHDVKSWYEEFGLIPRFPRPPVGEIRELWKGLRQPQLFLRERREYDEIVFRVRRCSGIFLTEQKKGLAKFGLTLSTAFEDILWEKLEGHRNTTWVELAGRAIEAYRQTWLHFFSLVYLGHFHPLADKSLKEIQRELASSGKVTQPGRPKTTLIERGCLHKRYAQLLKSCRLIHRAAERATASRMHPGTLSPADVRRAIHREVRKNIHGMPGDGYIFGGEAFNRIPCLDIPKLQNPKSWKPHQLAISLLAFERMQAYQTIQKTIALAKRGSRRA